MAVDRLLHSQRRHAVLVVIRLAAGRPKTSAPIDCDSSLIVLPDLKAQREFSALGRHPFSGFDQRPTEPLPGKVRSNGDRVETRSPRPGAEQSDAVARDAT